MYYCSAQNWLPWWQLSWGQHGANLGPIGPRWAPCWCHELCYLGSTALLNYKAEEIRSRIVFKYDWLRIRPMRLTLLMQRLPWGLAQPQIENGTWWLPNNWQQITVIQRHFGLIKQGFLQFVLPIAYLSRSTPKLCCYRIATAILKCMDILKKSWYWSWIHNQSTSVMIWDDNGVLL